MQGLPSACNGRYDGENNGIIIDSNIDVVILRARTS
jgi:hypothetical protein